MKMRCYGRYSKKASMRAVQLRRTAIERSEAVTTVKSEFSDEQMVPLVTADMTC